LIDGQSLNALLPPEGRKFHPGLVRLTSDGRFFFSSQGITDTATEKEIPTPWDYSPRPRYVPGIGTIGTDSLWQVRIFPGPGHLEFAPTLLELWSQVVARGTLDEKGSFVKWDELKWEQSRQHLASLPAPYSRFPFPGQVVVDRLYWLRQEFESAKGAERARIARQILERAHLTGDKLEATRWTAVVAGDVVSGLATKPLLRAEVVERLRLDLSLDSDVRAAALTKAAQLVEDANDLNREAWHVALRANASQADYGRALRWAQEAVALRSEDLNFANTLGLLQYRSGFYKEAITTLTHAEQGNSRNGAPRASTVAFLAMAHHALGHGNESQTFMQKLTDLLKRDPWKSDEEVKATLEETKRTLSKKP
jgi:hypothetical protein